VFIDETWASWPGVVAALQEASGSGPAFLAATTTFLAGLRITGMMAPVVLDGPINRLVFQAYVEQVLVPQLSPGDIVGHGQSVQPQRPCGVPSHRSSRSVCSTFRPTALTSIPSRTPLPS
jgi:hypothetical protein